MTRIRADAPRLASHHETLDLTALDIGRKLGIGCFVEAKPVALVSHGSGLRNMA